MKRKIREYVVEEEEVIEEKKCKVEPKVIQLSKEQKNVVDLVCKKENVLVISKAGCGKTSVSLAAAQKFYELHNSRTLLITYNSRLKTETRNRIKLMKLDHMIEAGSYHSYAYRYFANTHTGGPDDSLIHASIQVQATEDLNFGLIIIDEAQDMCQLYYDFLMHLLKHMISKPVMLIVGDPMQSLYKFNGATLAFLSEPEKHFGALLNTSKFLTRHLSISFRISHEMASFINTNLNPNNLQYSVDESWWHENKERISAWWGRGIFADPRRKPDPNSVKIIRGWGAKDAIVAAKKLFSNYGNDNVALLSFSLKGTKSPIHTIVDKLGKADSENWVVLDGKQSGGDDVIRGKRVASTVHRMKGLEFDGILFCGLDSFIEKLYQDDPLGAFNINYVACTRAKKQLIVNIAGTDYATIRCSPLLNTTTARQCCQVSQLIEYVPFDEILSVPENLFTAKVIVNHSSRALKIPPQAFLVPGRCSGTVEDLTPFLSRAISFRLMLLTHQELHSIDTETYADDKHFDRDMLDFINEIYLTPPLEITWTNLLKYAVAYETIKSRYTHLWRQLSQYDPSNTEISDILEKCTENAMFMLWEYAVSKNLVQRTDNRANGLKKLLQFESAVSFPLFLKWFTKSYTGQLSGTVDILFNDNTIMGIECADSISGEVGMELELYSAMKRLQDLESKDPHETVMILTNTAQLVNVKLKIQPIHEKVPADYEFIHRVVRRKMQLKPATPTELLKDYISRS